MAAEAFSQFFRPCSILSQSAKKLPGDSWHLFRHLDDSLHFSGSLFEACSEKARESAPGPTNFTRESSGLLSIRGVGSGLVRSNSTAKASSTRILGFFAYTRMPMSLKSYTVFGLPLETCEDASCSHVLFQRWMS